MGNAHAVWPFDCTRRPPLSGKATSRRRCMTSGFCNATIMFSTPNEHFSESRHGPERYNQNTWTGSNWDVCFKAQPTVSLFADLLGSSADLSLVDLLQNCWYTRRVRPRSPPRPMLQRLPTATWRDQIGPPVFLTRRRKGVGSINSINRKHQEAWCPRRIDICLTSRMGFPESCLHGNW